MQICSWLEKHHARWPAERDGVGVWRVGFWLSAKQGRNGGDGEGKAAGWLEEGERRAAGTKERIGSDGSRLQWPSGRGGEIRRAVG